MSSLRGGTEVGGSQIVTKADVPVIFRVNNSKLEYSGDNGITWVQMSDTNDATAAAAQILAGYTAYIGGTKVTGTMKLHNTSTNRITPALSYDGVSNNGILYAKPEAGFFDGSDGWTQVTDANFTAANILAGKTIFGRAGTAQRYATGTTTATTVAATLGWQPRVVAIREIATGGVYGGFWLAFGPTFQRNTQVIVSGDGVYVPYVYDYPATTYNFMWMTYQGVANVGTLAVINATGFSLATASYGNAGASFVWYAWE